MMRLTAGCISFGTASFQSEHCDLFGTFSLGAIMTIRAILWLNVPVVLAQTSASIVQKLDFADPFQISG